MMTTRQAAAIRWASLALIGVGVLLLMRAAPTYVARLARSAIQQRTRIAQDDEAGRPPRTAHSPEPVGARAALSVAATALVALAIFAGSVGAITHQTIVRQSVERVLGLPPAVAATEAYKALFGVAAVLILIAISFPFVAPVRPIGYDQYAAGCHHQPDGGAPLLARPECHWPARDRRAPSR